jgi:opacity protein-like surface antigen
MQKKIQIVNIYVGVSVGNPSSKDKDDLGDKNKKSFTSKVFGGYNINDNVAIEGHYSNKITDISDDSGDNYQMKSLGVAVVYGLPFETYTPFVKLGYHRWNFTENEDGNPAINTKGNDLFFGLGTNIAINDRFNLRLEAERFNYNNSDGDSVKTNLFSIGIVYNF